MKHYYHPMSRAVTTDWMLKELDAPHEQIVINFPEGENRSDTFRAINPMEKLPALDDDGTIITETAAICAYLADRFPDAGMAPAPDSKARGRYYRYLFFAGMTLEPAFTFDQYGVTDYPKESAGFGDTGRALATAEAMTPDQGWVMGDTFTAADVVFGGTLDFCVQFGWLPTPGARVASYVTRLKQRPAYLASHDAFWHTIPA